MSSGREPAVPGRRIRPSEVDLSCSHLMMTVQYTRADEDFDVSGMMRPTHPNSAALSSRPRSGLLVSDPTDHERVAAPLQMPLSS